MQILKENKIIIIIIAIIIAILIWYGMSKGKSADNPLTSSSMSSSQKSVDDRDLLQLLTDMRNIRLDGHIFESTAYLSLQDFSRNIVPEPVGRQDPFAPVTQPKDADSIADDLSGRVLDR